LPDAFTVIARVVAPFDQRYDAPADAVSVTLPPAQNVVAPLAVIAATGGSMTVTVTGALVALHESSSTMTL
jgi:ribonuclease PH